MRTISFIIPCYNSENTIEKVIEEIKTTVNRKDEYEIILINDYSEDNVWEKITNLARNDKNIKAINFNSNYGQHAALLAGFREATGDLIVSIDDDNQIPINEVYSLINKIDEGFDVVYAFYRNKKHSKFRNFGTYLNNLMCEKLLRKPKNIMITSFFVAQKYIIKEIIKYTNPYTYISGLILRSTKNIASVPVNHRKREIGASGYTLRKLLNLWINGFTSFSVVPLRISIIMGCLFAMSGFIYIIFVIFNKIFNPNVLLGWSSTISVILFMGGIILMALGLIGEYIGRIYISINKSPQYIIKETINIK